jgi:hypothetical protein
MAIRHDQEGTTEMNVRPPVLAVIATISIILEPEVPL